MKLYADTVNTRAWPGGMGFAKAGGNYAPTILPAVEAQDKHGCAQASKKKRVKHDKKRKRRKRSSSEHFFLFNVEVHPVC